MGTKVKPVLTMWAMPLAHHQICVRMCALLSEAGIDSVEERVRMTAHSIVASGWIQNVWHHNAWGVRIGSWAGDWYKMGTEEENAEGNLVDDKGARWRAFGSWSEAISDYKRRISPTNGGFAAAAKIITQPGPDCDAGFWAALGKGNYYTDTKRMTPPKFASICARVRRELAKASPVELVEAQSWAQVALRERLRGLTIPFVVTAVAMATLLTIGLGWYIWTRTGTDACAV